MNSMNGPKASVTANGQVPYSYEMEKFYFEIEILEIEGDIGFGTTCMASVHTKSSLIKLKFLPNSLKDTLLKKNGRVT